jgi:hypothetical protein
MHARTELIKAIAAGDVHMQLTAGETRCGMQGKELTAREGKECVVTASFFRVVHRFP